MVFMVLMFVVLYWAFVAGRIHFEEAAGSKLAMGPIGCCLPASKASVSI